ncbi:MAG: DUF84 family protein [Ktedonobacteraceae bacterium]|nr:DUF84 family protein [Ktedonobacteraceae bacterium]MBO0794430.1 DUF84 family protein [Ktedonobacteraceae bacterium]
MSDTDANANGDLRRLLDTGTSASSTERERGEGSGSALSGSTLERPHLRIVIADNNQYQVEPLSTAEVREGEPPFVVSSLDLSKGAAFGWGLLHFGVNEPLIQIEGRSGVSAMPRNEEETRTGAENRAKHARDLFPEAPVTFGPESGIYDINVVDKYYVGYTILAANLPNGEFVYAKTDGIVLPRDAVEENFRRGMDQCTVGQILEEWGRVEKHNDIEQSLVGVPREEFIYEAALRLFEKLRKRGEI